MLIQSIKLDGLLSFGPDTEALTLRPLNVLIGANGSGKSNFVEAVGLLHAVPTDFAAPMRTSRNAADWIWQGEPKASAARLEAVVNATDEQALRYSVEFTARGEDPLIDSERVAACFDTARPEFELLSGSGRQAQLRRHRSAGNPLPHDVRDTEPGQEDNWEDSVGWSRFERLDPANSVLPQVVDLTLFPQLDALREGFRTISLHREWSFGHANAVRQQQHTDRPNRFLLEDNSNLGLVLNRLARDTEVKERLLSALRDLYDGIADFYINIEHNAADIYLTERNGAVTVPATRLSDGTLRYLCLLAILCDPEPPPLVCIEEPELGLHPDVISGLAALLRDASERCQLIVTTHSDTLVDALTDSPESVVVCDKENGRTLLRRLDQQELSHWLERYRLGELWSSGEIGGNRW